jgi:predicted 2-oxoglutarate/Fe(II)-dependent dioxygenase YbiX
MNFPTLIADKLISNEDCDFLLNGISECKFQRYNNAESYRPEDDDDIFNGDIFKYNKFKDIVLGLSSFVEKHYVTTVLNIYGNVFMKYENTQNIRLHKDYDMDDPYQAAKEPFNISSVFYLNDDYQGGKLIFPNESDKPITERENRLEFIPKQGSVIFFDSSLIHYTELVTYGTKYVLTNFYDVLENN